MKKLCITTVLLLAILIASCSQVFAYSDVSQGDWFYENVLNMSEAGLLSGYPDGSFLPNSPITCAEFVSVAARAASPENSKTAQASHWAAKQLQTALDSGWYDWDEIPPTGESYDNPIPRYLATKIIMNAFLPEAVGDYSLSSKITDFQDLNGRYYNAVLAAYSEKIVYGDENGRFNPNSSLTRAEACALISRAASKSTGSVDNSNTEFMPVPTAAPVTKISGGVSENGSLQVIGTQLCNESGEPVVLRGMSSHGIHWFGSFLDSAAIQSTADRGANLFRLAMYTAENGYISNPDSVEATLINAIDTVISLDMYVIIDWHILSDSNPNTYKTEAIDFFRRIAERYKDSPAVIYEICNEPNGNVTWTGDVKPYAETLINEIRAINPDSVILVGSPTWSQDLHEAAKSPLEFNNIMYTCHFYAGTHTQWLRDRISAAISGGLPVFISEWGTSDASGSGGVYLDETAVWLDFLSDNSISWANWSLCDKNESSAALINGANPYDGIQDEELSESGRYVFSRFID